MSFVQIPSQFRKWFDGKHTLDIEANTVGELLLTLEKQSPRLKGHLIDSKGNLKNSLRVFIDGTDVDEINGLETHLTAKSKVTLLMALAGG